MLKKTKLTRKWNIPAYSLSNDWSAGMTWSMISFWNVKAPTEARNQQFPKVKVHTLEK